MKWRRSSKVSNQAYFWGSKNLEKFKKLPIFSGDFVEDETNRSQTQPQLHQEAAPILDEGDDDADEEFSVTKHDASKDSKNKKKKKKKKRAKQRRNEEQQQQQQPIDSFENDDEKVEIESVYILLRFSP